jgi:hypothetical protein
MSRSTCSAILVFLLLSPGCGSDDSAPTDPGGTTTDETAPAAVTDLRLERLTDTVLEVVWTAPGDDGTEGTATAYDVRYSPDPITEANWSSSAVAPFVPDPAIAGTEQKAQITTIPEPDVYLAVKAADEVPNWSAMSNLLHVVTDPSAIQIHRLVTDGYDDHPSVNDGVVCWVSRHGDQDDIWVANVRVAHPSPTRLTDNGGHKDFPSNHGSERIVWQGREDDPYDWEIWVYDKNAIPRYRALTDDGIDDTRPVLAGGGDFAWLHGHILHEAVHYWDEASHSASVLSDDCCPTTGWFAQSLTAHDGSVLWRACDRVGTEGYQAKVWDGVLRDISEELGCPLSIDYSLHDGAVAFEYLHEGQDWIAYWDGVHPLQPIVRGYEPSLYAGTFAYERWDGDWEIFYWDGDQEIRITDNDWSDTQPSLHDGVVAWKSRLPGIGDQIHYAVVPE